jgi:hypothetical protein
MAYRTAASTLFPRAVTSERAENRGERVTGSEWTCARCGMTSRFMDEAIDLSELPANWDELNGIAYCLGCRREMAGQARAAAVTDVDSPADRLRADAEGRIEFELSRDPDRCDTRIARACRTNVIVVRQVRERVGAYPTRPV